MRIQFFLFFAMLWMGSEAQNFIDPFKLPAVPYKPSVHGVNLKNEIGIDMFFSQGIKIVLADKSFRVIQFDVIYDCHSRSLVDFSTKRYLGDHVDPGDMYFRKRVLAGDLMDIANTVIEKDGIQYVMQSFSFIVTK